MKTKDKLLLAAEQRFLQKGYTATTVDEICSSAGATKGAFFHHFPSKEALALTVVEAHGRRRFEMLTESIVQSDDPVSRVYGFIDHVVRSMMEAEESSCLVAALTLEMAGVNPKFRAVCAEAFHRLTSHVCSLMDEALTAQRVTRGPTPKALAEQFVATYQGALVLARAQDDRQVVKVSIEQFRDYLGRVLAHPAPAAQVA